MINGLKTLVKGFSISGHEHLGMLILYAEGSLWNGDRPVLAVIERQLDHMIEVHLAKWSLHSARSGRKCKEKDGANNGSNYSCPRFSSLISSRYILRD